MVAFNLEPVTNKQGQSMYIQYKHDGKHIYYDLCKPVDGDIETYTPKTGCTLFRLLNSSQTNAPIVCINTSKNLVYFLTSYDIDSTTNTFCSKGIKINFDKTLDEIIQN